MESAGLKGSLKILGLAYEMCNKFNGILKIRSRQVIYQKKIQKINILGIRQSEKGISLNYSMIFEIMTAVSNHPVL